MDTIKLNNGVDMPVLGLGTFLTTDPMECKQSVKEAIRIGYRLIDTAQGYGNEAYIGEAIAESGIAREELFITTKVWFRNYESTRASIEKSMADLRVNYLDLVLLHWPFGDVYAAYRALEELNKEGKIRAIGVSNFNADRLVDLINFTSVVPAVNQIETNLLSQQLFNREWMTKYGVAHQGYAPLGQGKMEAVYTDARLVKIAEKYGKTTRQVALRFQIQSGVAVIPKSVHTVRLKENFDLFDFMLSTEDMEVLRLFDTATPFIGNPTNPALVESSINWG